MKKLHLLLFAILLAISPAVRAQDSPDMKKGTREWTELEKQLADINDQWVCAHKYHKNHGMDCVDFKRQIWPEKFFEISREGEITDKAEMVKRQTKRAIEVPTMPGDSGPNPQEFILRAVYGNVAIATDHTIFKAPDASGKVVVTDEASVLRLFVKLNGRWVPAGAALVPIKK